MTKPELKPYFPLRYEQNFLYLQTVIMQMLIIATSNS